ncbi:hypothetical protein PQX77_013366 [Marasmius sp. AFHP31]|nr:hypothetical protein PQX77_013366 [Marasmius sp. AFHP31]
MGAHQVPDSDDNQQQIIPGPEVFLKIAATGLVSPPAERIRQASEREAEVLKGLRDLKSQGPSHLVNGLLEWEEDNGRIEQYPSSSPHNEMISMAKTRTRKGKAPARETSSFEPGPSRIPTYTGSTSGAPSSRRPSLSAAPQTTSNPSSTNPVDSPQSVSANLASGQVLVNPLPTDSPVAQAAGMFGSISAEPQVDNVSTAFTVGAERQSEPASTLTSTDSSLFGWPSIADRELVLEMDRSWRDTTRKQWLPEGSRLTPRYEMSSSTPVHSSSSPSVFYSSDNFTPNPFGSSEVRDSRVASSRGDTTPRATPGTVTESHRRGITPLNSLHLARSNDESITEFYDRIRNMYVLQMVRNRDLSQFSTTNIPQQPIVIEGNQFYSREHPHIRMATFELNLDELADVRTTYVEPFGPHNHVRSRMGNSRHSPREDYPRFSGEPEEPSDPESNHGNHSKPPSDRAPEKGSRKSKSRRSAGGGPLGPPNGPPDGNGSDNEGTNSDPDRTSSDEGSEHNSQHRKKQVRRFVSATNADNTTVFGQTRYTSVDTTFSEKETFTYDPRPLSETEILRAAFKRFEDMIIFQLLGAKVSDKTTSNL